MFCLFVGLLVCWYDVSCLLLVVGWWYMDVGVCVCVCERSVWWVFGLCCAVVWVVLCCGALCCVDLE